MATASPTPLGSGHSSTIARKPSLRLGLRRAPSRQQVNRTHSNPTTSTSHASSRSQFAAANGDSSDDEIPVPMKLSALTKALLNDDAPDAERGAQAVRARAGAQIHRPSSPAVAPQQEKPTRRRSVLGSSIMSSADEKRHTRASSAQLPAKAPSPARSQVSQESSPVRKRVVRLSTSGAAAAAPLNPSRRRSTSLSVSQRRNRPPSRNSQGEERGNVSEVRDANTPVAQPARSVRIAVGSSGNRGRSTGSSGLFATGADAPHHPEDEAPEEPATAPRQRSSINYTSSSRPSSNGSRSRVEDNQAIQSSMRVKRVGKPGSFLSGPARRGRRRQSEEEGEDGEPLPISQEAESQLPPDLMDLDNGDHFASSYYGPDRVESGSPVSDKAPVRSVRESSILGRGAGRMLSRQASPERDEIPIPHYKVPPPRSDVPSRHDQENEAPPTFKKNQAAESSFLERDFAKAPSRPTSAGIGAPRLASPDRKALVPISQNKGRTTPRRAAPPPPPKMSILDAATSAAGAATAQQANKKRIYMKCNGKHYTRLDSLGRGGSAKVYRVAADNGKMFALKRVMIENADEVAIRGYKGEIDLLRKLDGCERVINLYDYEMNDEKKVLSLVMEMGELDLNSLLRIRMSPEKARFDPVFVRFYWQEMLECLAAVHEYDIVHSDLKPANFVIVQGRLKLIDFGIANAIQTDETVNVHRETQIGTPNYMSPESLLDSNTMGPDGRRVSSHSHRHGAKLMKLGKPSDVWSLGCILFQMVYGTPPFGHIPNQMARCHAIIDWDYAISFLERGVGGAPVPPSLLRTMRRCLQREQHLRPTCRELLRADDPFLFPVELPEGQLPVSRELLGQIIHSVVARCRDGKTTEAEAAGWPGAYWGSLEKAVRKDVR